MFHSNSEVCALTCRERHEGIWLYKRSILVKEVFRVEFMGGFPLSFFIQHRGQIRDDNSSLKKKKKKRLLLSKWKDVTVETPYFKLDDKLDVNVRHFTVSHKFSFQICSFNIFRKMFFFMSNKTPTNFRYGVSHQLCVSCGGVENTEGNSVSCPLALMDNSLHWQR